MQFFNASKLSRKSRESGAPSSFQPAETAGKDFEGRLLRAILANAPERCSDTLPGDLQRLLNVAFARAEINLQRAQ